MGEVESFVSGSKHNDSLDSRTVVWEWKKTVFWLKIN